MTRRNSTFRIAGTEYDLTGSIQRASIKNLIELKRTTADNSTGGISIKSISRVLVEMGNFENPIDIFDSIETLEVFAALVFLCKRKAGDTITFDEACDFALADCTITFAADEGEDGDPKDPSTPDEPEVEQTTSTS